MADDDLFSWKGPPEPGGPPPPSGVPPEIVDLFERLALKIAGQGWSRYSARGIFHRIRWHFQIDKGNRSFKCNNNWTAELARWFLTKHPEHPEFFELRERIDDGYQEAAE